MAQRRMFSLSVVDTDMFLDMPASTQALYFHLGMRADDDGFVASPKKITAMVNCSADDLRLLIAKNFLIVFPSGVCVVRDWKQNNYIQRDRYHATRYITEKAMLSDGEDGAYSLLDTSCIQNVSIMDTEVRLGKESIGKSKSRASIGDICAEPETVSTPPVISLPLNDGSEYGVDQKQIDEWTSLYPAVDVLQQLRNMRGWLIANPDRKKTKRGVNRFITSWLAKEQDKGGRLQANYQAQTKRTQTNTRDAAAYDIRALLKREDANYG